MIGWAISLYLFLTWVDSGLSNYVVLIAAGLFAIAGSIGYGLNRVAERK